MKEKHFMKQPKLRDLMLFDGETEVFILTSEVEDGGPTITWEKKLGEIGNVILYIKHLKTSEKILKRVNN